MQQTYTATSFPTAAPAAMPVFYRTYSRRNGSRDRENWEQVCDRTIEGLKQIGDFDDADIELIAKMQSSLKALPSGRWLWIGGTQWSQQAENFFGCYNCTSTNVVDWNSFGLMMNLSMQGCGTGAVLEPRYIDLLSPIFNYLTIKIVVPVGSTPKHGRHESTMVHKWYNDSSCYICVGDSRQGWVKAYQALIELATDLDFEGKTIEVAIDLGDVRPSGEPLSGFGGIANPVKLPEMFSQVAAVLNKAQGRKLTSVECSLLIDEAALAVVAGNVRRSAGIRQGISSDTAFANSKDNLWKRLDNGSWQIDPSRAALTMANHTRVFHHLPTVEECIDSVRSQYYSGEGAIQWAGEALARSNADILDSIGKRLTFVDLYAATPSESQRYLAGLYYIKYGIFIGDEELKHRMQRYALNPCFRGDMRLLTVDGYKRFDELDGTKSLIVNSSGYVSLSTVWCSGERETVELILTTGQSIFCTPDHVFLTFNGEKEAQDCSSQQLMPYLKKPEHEPEFVALGFIQGDGQLSRLYNDDFLGMEVNIGKSDSDILTVFDSLHNLGVDYKWHGHRAIYVHGLKAKLIQNGFLATILPQRGLPLTYSNWTLQQKRAFLNGLFSANGSVIASGRITLKTTCHEMAVQLCNVLKDDFGINAYCTTNKPKAIAFPNGTYQCRESYDVNIQQYQSRLTFFNEINFSLDYKSEKLAKILLAQAPVVRAVKPSDVVKVYDFSEPIEHWGVVEGFVAHNCAEVLGSDFMCNLSEIHLNQIDPTDLNEQFEAFTAGALSVAALLHQRFTEPRYQKSRELDPIVGVSFTGLFDFFVRYFGVEWLQWWEAGRPKNWGEAQVIAAPLGVEENKSTVHEYECVADYFRAKEREFLSFWQSVVQTSVWNYCDRHKLKRPNRCTVVQPAGTKSLLTGASHGWHPPFSQYYIRRITFSKNDPVALACLDYGYSVIPAASAKDEQGNLLDDPFDERTHDWLVEIPVQVPWADIPGAADVNVSDFSALAKFDFYMQVQKYYTQHNTSGTINLKEAEIEPLGKRIHRAIRDCEGYVSVALTAQSAPFPRLPYEEIDRDTYLMMMESVQAKRKSENFQALLQERDRENASSWDGVAGPAGCDSDKCLFGLS